MRLELCDSVLDTAIFCTLGTVRCLPFCPFWALLFSAELLFRFRVERLRLEELLAFSELDTEIGTESGTDGFWVGFEFVWIGLGTDSGSRIDEIRAWFSELECLTEF